MMDSKQIRQKFKDFFEEKSHKIVASDSMIIKNDPSLMFTNAGMNQFKDIFLGSRKPESLRIHKNASEFLVNITIWKM